MAKLAYYMILSDGETFTDLAGCKIIAVPDNWDTDKIEEALGEDDDELVVVTEFS
jgi:hypothetical protein